jgi:hypothetical protein
MDAPFDRGEIDRASLDATERLRARLSGRPVTPPPPRRSVLPWVIAGGLFVFTAGMIANPWFERSIRTRLALDPAVVTATPTPAAVPVTVAPVADPAAERLARTEAKVESSVDQLARDAERIDTLTRDVASIEARVDAETDRTEAASAAAIAAAERAQGMIAILLAREAIESGRRLDGVEAVLRQSFEARYPQAVAAISALGVAPVTVPALQRDFARLNPVATGARLDWWQTLTAGVRTLVTRPTGPSQAPHEAAAAALGRGDVAAASNHLRRLPEPRSASVIAWLAAADRWQAGMAALTTLETAAIVAPVPAAPVAPAS